MSSKLLLVLSFLLLSTSALAQDIHDHRWYPPACCNGNDCKPVSCNEIKLEQDGSYTYQGKNFSKAISSPSKDSECHVCMSQVTGNPFCLFYSYGY